MTPLHFRAWLKDDRKMVFMDQPEYRGQWSFFFVEANDHHPYGVGISHYQAEIEDTDSWSPDQIILMQSTGLKDKNGKEIFEGDVCTDRLGESGVVEWLPALAAFVVRPLWKDADSKYYWFNKGDFENATSTQLQSTEVIGNIYENPSLLS